MSSDILNYADDISPYECTPYYDKLKENLEMQFTKYLIGSSIIISNLMLRNVIFSYRPISLVPQTSMVELLKVVIRKKKLRVTIDSNFKFFLCS